MLPPGDQPLFYSESPYYLATRDFVFHVLSDEMARNITQWCVFLYVFHTHVFYESVYYHTRSIV